MLSAQNQSSRPGLAPSPLVTGKAVSLWATALLGCLLATGCGSESGTTTVSPASGEDGRSEAPADGGAGATSPGAATQKTPEPEADATPAVRFGVAELELVDDSEGHVEFGEVFEGVKLVHTFRLRATGETASKIRKLKPSCKCTRGKAFLIDEAGKRQPYKNGQPIEVGDEIEIDLIVSTEGERGELRTSLDVLTNSEEGRVQLTTRVFPKSVFEIEEGDGLFFGEVSVGRRIERRVRFWSDHLEPFQVSVDETTSAPELELTVSPVGVEPGQPSRRWELLAVFGPVEKIGFKTYPVQLLTDVPIPWPKYPSRGGAYGLSFQGQADVVQPLSVEPATLAFGEVDGGHVVEQVARVSVADPEFTLQDTPTPRVVVRKGPEDLADLLRVRVELVEDGRAMDVHVGFDPVPEGLSGPFVGRLELDVAHPRLEKVKIRFSGVFGD